MNLREFKLKVAEDNTFAGQVFRCWSLQPLNRPGVEASQCSSVEVLKRPSVEVFKCGKLWAR